MHRPGHQDGGDGVWLVHGAGLLDEEITLLEIQWEAGPPRGIRITLDPLQ